MCTLWYKKINIMFWWVESNKELTLCDCLKTMSSEDCVLKMFVSCSYSNEVNEEFVCYNIKSTVNLPNTYLILCSIAWWHVMFCMERQFSAYEHTVPLIIKHKNLISYRFIADPLQMTWIRLILVSKKLKTATFRHTISSWMSYLINPSLFLYG